MRRTFSERRSFPVPMRWRHAGSDLTRSKHVDQRTDRSFMRSEGLPKSLLHAPRLASLRTRPSCRANVAPAIDAGADIKDAMRRTKARLSLSALSFVPS